MLTALLKHLCSSLQNFGMIRLTERVGLGEEDRISSSITLKESNIVNFIKLERIKWAGQVVRMDDDRTTKKAFNAQPISTQRKGRPNLRWIDVLEKDLLVLRTKNWENTNRKMVGLSGKGFFRRPRPTLGCRAVEGGRNGSLISLEYLIFWIYVHPANSGIELI
ncbi:uncharacterized protein TNCV_1620921 [Trichonephila clavipes]|nr:uncharacterized protein TNCV_1620921 [Trichonephila clavipes]